MPGSRAASSWRGRRCLRARRVTRDSCPGIPDQPEGHRREGPARLPAAAPVRPRGGDLDPPGHPHGLHGHPPPAQVRQTRPTRRARSGRPGRQPAHVEEILLTGIEDVVHFGKAFDRYEELDDGCVRAHFADGSSADGSLLVGADGTGSRVRGQLVPDAVIDDLGWAVYGRTPLADDLLADTPADLIDTFNRVIAADGTAISIATCRTSGPNPQPLTDVPDHLSWTMSAAGPRPDGASPRELHELATRTVVDWAPGVRRIVAEADVPATFLLTITSARPIAPWLARSVTLLGDAVHTMSPGRGDGANIALRDARVLTDLLARGTPLTEAKAEYEQQMLRYGFAAVAASREQPFAPAGRR
ncbi:hypothetical protein GCM10029964_125380 [Kibdelosporangium lantanae]